jgi:8-oxo-dGTP pyrophosphatase MutT (NUDIX family)
MSKTESAGGIVLNKDDLVLLVSQHGTSWSLPKGHIERGEDKIQAAKREIYEETGITELKLIKELGAYQRYKIDEYGKEDKNEYKTIHMFLFKTNQDMIKPIDSENPEAKWVSKNEVANVLTHPKDKEFFLNVLNKF